MLLAMLMLRLSLFFLCHYTMFIVILLLFHAYPWNPHHEVLFLSLKIMLLFSGGTRVHILPLLFIFLHAKVLIFNETRHHYVPLISYLSFVFIPSHFMNHGVRNLVWKMEEMACVFAFSYCMFLRFLRCMKKRCVSRSVPLDRMRCFWSCPSISYFVR